MSYSVAKVCKIYQNVRAFCRKYPECKSLHGARVKKDLELETKLDLTGDLTAKEEKALNRMCDKLGI